MKKIRLIPRLDIKGKKLIKGIQLEGLRVMGDPNHFAKSYYEQGADEIIYMDAVASLYDRNSIMDIIEKTLKDVFIPVTVGGGIRTYEDVLKILTVGADKVAINTAAIKNPDMISELSNHFGSQCIVLSIEAKQTGNGKWEAYTENGRERTGKDVVEWAERGISLGAGEILLTSVDREGTRKGYDYELVEAVKKKASVPVIASGGMGTPDDLIKVVNDGKADAIAMADILHYKRATIGDLRKTAITAGISIRKE